MPDPEDRPESDPAVRLSGKTGKPAPADLQAYIGDQLRAAFDDVASQPVPDRFLDLMKRLG